MFRFLAHSAGSAPVRALLAASSAALLAALLAATPAAAFNETGGSGLIRTEQAYSLPIGRPLFSFYAGMYSNDFTPGTSRLLTVTPSLTLGLGAGFEGSAALAFEGLTSSLSDEEFTRRFDFRRRALQTKLRWTTDLGGPRLRGGFMGHLTLPLGEDGRPGAVLDPDTNYDTGVMALLSANVGWLNVPIRVHLNAGYWWSRDDGAFIYRSLPTSIPVSGLAPDRNDVLEYGLAVEAGLGRALVFVELRSEQFVDARSVLAARENLWQLTPGFRTQLSSTVGLTGGISFDLSGNNDRTVFDPATSYPDFELKAGLTLGSVRSREQHEASRRRGHAREMVAELPAETGQGTWLVPAAAPTEAAPAEAPAAPPAAVAEPTVTPAVLPAAGPAAPIAAPVVAAAPAPAPEAAALRIRELEDRLARVETAQRLAWLEARLATLEGRPLPVTMAAPVATPVAEAVAAPVIEPAATPAVAPAPAPEPLLPPSAAAPATARVDSLAVTTAPAAAPVSPAVQAQLDLLQSGLQQLLEQRAAAPAAAIPAAAPPAASLPPPGERSTVVVGDAGGIPPAVAVPAPAMTAALPPAADLDPALRQPYRPAEETTVSPPAIDVPPATLPAADPVAEPFATPPLGLEIGQRRPLDAIDVAAEAPLAAAAALAELDALAAELAARPAAGVALLVHGGGPDRGAALADTDRLAGLLRDYLVAAGTPEANVVPIGMGLAEGGAPRAEIERIR